MKLVDTYMNKGLFTWNNKRGGEAHVASKLDKFIISEEHMLINQEVLARVLPFGGSYHWPVQLEITDIGIPRNRPFRLENISLNHLDFIRNIEKWWLEDCRSRGQACSYFIKDLSTSSSSLKIGIRRILAIFLRKKNPLKTKWRFSTKLWSRKALINSKVIKLIRIINIGKIYVNKRKFFGDKSLEFNAS